MAQEKTILIVDDDPDIVESTRVVLESAGYRVMSASNGAEATARIEREIPDLILLDIMMAEPTEGFHLGYKLREDPVYAHIPIIIVSASASSAIWMKTKAAMRPATSRLSPMRQTFGRRSNAVKAAL